MRVPVPDGSVTDLVATLKKKVTVEEVNAALISRCEHFSILHRPCDGLRMHHELHGTPARGWQRVTCPMSNARVRVRVRVRDAKS